MYTITLDPYNKLTTMILSSLSTNGLREVNYLTQNHTVKRGDRL